MIEILFGIVEAIVSFFIACIESIASLFTVGGEALGAGEAILLMMVLLVEVIYWLVLWIVELVTALIYWRKPKKIGKPKIWRPKKRKSESKERDSQ